MKKGVGSPQPKPEKLAATKDDQVLCKGKKNSSLKQKSARKQKEEEGNN